jgi:hypothetical protein
VGEAAIRIGVLGLGSVFHGPYTGRIERFATAAREIGSDVGRREPAALEQQADGRRVHDPALGVDLGEG